MVAVATRLRTTTGEGSGSTERSVSVDERIAESSDKVVPEAVSSKNESLESSEGAVERLDLEDDDSGSCSRSGGVGVGEGEIRSSYSNTSCGVGVRVD